jgi:hypothetical protein
MSLIEIVRTDVVNLTYCRNYAYDFYIRVGLTIAHTKGSAYIHNTSAYDALPIARCSSATINTILTEPADQLLTQEEKHEIADEYDFVGVENMPQEKFKLDCATAIHSLLPLTLTMHGPRVFISTQSPCTKPAKISCLSSNNHLKTFSPCASLYADI